MFPVIYRGIRAPSFMCVGGGGLDRYVYVCLYTDILVYMEKECVGSFQFEMNF